MERGERPESQGYVDPQLEQMQRIEMGGPMRKVKTSQLPKGLRVGYYIVMTLLMGMGLFGVYLNFFK